MTRKSKSPVSENEGKFHANWSAEDCISELRRIVDEHPEMIITRNFFRNKSVISEATWNRYFGTFMEFKRAAGVTLTRQQHALEKHIAKHRAVDHYREMNKERQEWGDKYIRKNKTRFQTILVASDLHDIECDEFWLKVFLDTAKRVQPDVIVLNGDIFDLPEFGSYQVDPRQWDVVGRIKYVHTKILAPLRKACPDAQITFVEGNHEYRLLRHLTDSTPALKAVLSDLHNMTISGLLGLDEYEINYVAKGDLAAYRVGDIKKELGKNYEVFFDCYIAHHFPEGRHLGLPGINGHNHKWKVWDMYNETHGAYQWMQLGCGHVRDATYCNGNLWSLGFAMAHIDTHKKLVNHEYIPVTEHAVVGGKFYYREGSK